MTEDDWPDQEILLAAQLGVTFRMMRQQLDSDGIRRVLTFMLDRYGFQISGLYIQPNEHIRMGHLPRAKAPGLVTGYSAGDTRHRDTGYVAAAATIGRMTPADYGNIGPPVEHGSSQDREPGALLLTLARLAC